MTLLLGQPLGRGIGVRPRTTSSSSSSGTPAGSPTTARINPSTKGTNGTIGGGNRTFTTGTAPAGVLFDTAFNPATAKVYIEVLVDLNGVSVSEGIYPHVSQTQGDPNGFGTGNATYGAAWRNLKVQEMYMEAAYSVAGALTRTPAPIFGPIVNGSTIQIQFAYGYLFSATNGYLSGLTDAQAQAGYGACAGPWASGSVYLGFHFNETVASLAIPSATAFAAPAIPGNTIY